MNLSAPTMLVFLISVVVAIVGLLVGLGILAMIPISGFWIMTAAFVVLAAGNLLKGV